MGDKLDIQLIEAAENGDLAGVKAALDAGVNVDVTTCGYCALEKAAGSTNPNALAIVKLLVDNGADVTRKSLLAWAIGLKGGKGLSLQYAAGSSNPDAPAILEYLATKGADIHYHNSYGSTVLTIALVCGRNKTADYLLSREDFRLSDLIPRPEKLTPGTYKSFRKKAISHVVESIDTKGILYAKTIAADIEQILKNENPKPTKEDVKALGIIARKISAQDWMNNAQVTSGDFSFGKLANFPSDNGEVFSNGEEMAR